MKTLNELSKQCHEIAKSKGFWDNPRETGTLLMLIVSELSEALESDRVKKYAELDVFDARNEDRKNMADFSADFQELIKDSFEDELADVLIRIFDLVGAMGIDIDRHILLKMQYNKTRGYKHGKEY